MNASASIEHLSEVLADEAQYSGRSEYRDPRSPNWTCFDDDKEIDPDLKAFRDDLLDFEEWNTGREFDTDETVQAGMFTVHRSIEDNQASIPKAFKRKVSITPHTATPSHSGERAVNQGSMTEKDGIKSFPLSRKERKRLDNIKRTFTRRPILDPVLVEEICDEFEATTDRALGIFTTATADKAFADWMRSMQMDRVRIPRITHKLAYLVGGRITPPWWNALLAHIVNFEKESSTTLRKASQETRKAVNTVGIPKDERRSIIADITREAINWNQYLANRLVIEIGMELGDDSIVPSKASSPWQTVIQSLALSGNASAMKLASWIRAHTDRAQPIDGTLFVNPDGSRYKTNGTNPGSAKASFIKRHSLEESFVSVDRVQYDGQKTSQYVIGVRKASNETPSHYYDPAPAWRDFEGGSYAPRACALFMVGESLTMPQGSHRLTVREFEQALIAGADCYDDADEALAGSIESDFAAEGSGYFEENDADPIDTERLYDGRVSMMETGLGAQGRPQSSFTEEEDYLMGILRMIGAERECEMLTMAHQEPNMIHRSMMSDGSYANVVSLLQFVAKDSPEMLDFVTAAICGDDSLQNPETHREGQMYSDAVALFDDDENAWAIPTGPNGACKRAACMNWK